MLPEALQPLAGAVASAHFASRIKFGLELRETAAVVASVM